MINDLKQVYTTELTHQQCKPTFSHEYALSKLKGLGYKLAVASNSIRPTVELMMEKSNLRPYLDVLFSNQDVAQRSRTQRCTWRRRLAWAWLQPSASWSRTIRTA